MKLLSLIFVLFFAVYVSATYDNTKDYLDGSKVCTGLSGSKLFDCYNTECKKRGPNERQGCAICQADCSQPDGPRICALSCPLGCVCVDGFIRGSNGACVSKSNCK